MSKPDFERRDIATSLGVVPLWARPGVFGSTRPLVVAIAGVFAEPKELEQLEEGIGILGEVCFVRVPGGGAPFLSGPSLADAVRAVDEAVAREFADRPVVAFGVSLGGAVALGLRGSSIRRIVAVEPLLDTTQMWPVRRSIVARLDANPQDAGQQTFAREMFGVARDAAPGRSHLAVLDGLRVPTDVLLGQTPLLPERAMQGFPSLVGEPERARLAVHPMVRLHQVQGGHQVMASAGKAACALALEALKRASAAYSFDRTGLDEPLLEATPLTVERVGHWGSAGVAFANSYGSRNPTGKVTLISERALPKAGSLDVLVLGAEPDAATFGRLGALVREGGWLVARWAPGARLPDKVRSLLGAHGFSPGAPVDAGGTGVLRARKAEPASVKEPLLLHYTAYASLLMDVRTRLPTNGLASDPELQVSYGTPPHPLPPMPLDAPKVTVMQRPAADDPEGWRAFMAAAIVKNWVVVLEYDDHPRLIADVHNLEPSPNELLRFGFVHAVQTSTPPLVEAFSPYNPETRMFPNAVFDLLPFPQGDRARRIFYGGVMRGAYALDVAKSLAPVFERFPEVQVLVIGDRAVFDALPAQGKHFLGYRTYESYLAMMARCSVSLSPIAALPMRETKSDAKFLDASRAGVLTIASPTIYDRTIQHGVNGLLAHEVEDWAPLLTRALAEPEWTRAIARRAWDEVRTTRMFAHQAAERRDWYWDLWRRREELNEAVMQRLPGLREAVAERRKALKPA